MAAEVDAAGECDERSTGHPVRRRRHTIEYRRYLSSRHVVGGDLHRARQPADRRVDEDRERDEENTDRRCADAQLFQHCHQQDEDDEAACVHPVDLGQVVNKGFIFRLTCIGHFLSLKGLFL